MNRPPQSALARLYQLAGRAWEFRERMCAGQLVSRMAESPIERLLVVREEGMLAPLLYPLDLGLTLGDSLAQAESVPEGGGTDAAVERLPSQLEPAPDRSTARGSEAAMGPARVSEFEQAAAIRRPPEMQPTSVTGPAITAERARRHWAARVEARPELRAAWQQPIGPQPAGRDHAALGGPLPAGWPQFPVDFETVTEAARALEPPPASLARLLVAPLNVLEQVERSLRRIEVGASLAQRTSVSDAAPVLPGHVQVPEVSSAPTPGPLTVQPPAPERAWVPQHVPITSAARTTAQPTELRRREASRGLRRLWELGRHSAPPVEAAFMPNGQPADPQFGDRGQSAQAAIETSFAANAPVLPDDEQFADMLARILRREAERHGIQLEDLAP